MLALSTALTILNSCVNTSTALITVSMSAMQSLQNPAVRTKTKLSCINQINQLALIRVPGHSGIHGNEKADEMADIGAALETVGHDPAPPISLSYIKARISEWSAEEFHNKWCNSAKAGTTKETLKYINMKSLPSLTTLHKPITNQTMPVLTGHGPFRSHLAKLQLVDEPSCPNCGSHQDTSMHFFSIFQKSTVSGNHTWQPSANSLRIDHQTLTCPIIASTFVIWQIL